MSHEVQADVETEFLENQINSEMYILESSWTTVVGTHQEWNITWWASN